MKLIILGDDQAVAQEAAREIAEAARAAIDRRGSFLLAVSGGRTPWQMLRLLAGQEVAWDRVHVVQVDERLAPLGHSDRNLTHLQASLPAHAARISAMPIDSGEPDQAAAWYCQTLRDLAGDPPVLDLIHLGLGPDGHTASLIPGDPVLNVFDRDVALTGAYQGRRRLTLTYPIINRARRILWMVTGEEKAAMLARLLNGDRFIPAGLVRQDQALVLADRAAAMLINDSGCS